MNCFGKILTVSIAAYQVENTIEKCLNSFLVTENLQSLELLVINDGSKDRTADIVSKYADKYPGIIYLVNKENGGHGSTINKSLSIAKGKFFKVLDGDDWVDATELDSLINFLKETSAELIIDKYREIYTDHTRVIGENSLYEYGRVYNFAELFPYKDVSKKLFAMHQTTILTKRLRDVKMNIMEKCFYADTMYIYYVGLAARTVAFHTSCTYQYRLGVEGQSVSESGVYKHIDDMLKIEYKLIQMYDSDSKNKIEINRDKYLFAIIDTRYNLIYDWYINLIPHGDKDDAFLAFLDNAHYNYKNVVSKCHLSKCNIIVAIYPALLIPLFRRIKRSCLWKMIRNVKNKFTNKF